MYPLIFRSLLGKLRKEIEQAESPLARPPADGWATTGVVLCIIMVITLAAGGLRLYSGETFTYSHPDEGIALAVITHVFESHDDDTNWARTDVFYKFKYDQYNFSSYYLFAAATEKLQGHTDFDLKHPTGFLLRNLRDLSAILGGLCVLFAGILGWRMGGPICGITASLLTGCSVTLFQDSLYARPDAFVTLVSLLVCLTLTSDKMHRSLVLTISGFLIGILIACKITFILYFPFPLLLAPVFLSTPGDGDPKNPHLIYWAGSLGAYFLSVLIGFYVGAPYAVKYPWEYLNGLIYLFKQYSGGWGPNGLQDSAGIFERLSYSSSYLIYTVGYPALALSALGIVRLVTRRDVRNILIFIAPLLTLIYFMQTKAFFERNFSQSLPMLFIMVGMGIQLLVAMIKNSKQLRLAVATLLLALSVFTPLSVTAKAIDPALDGRFKSEVDAKAKALSENGTLMVFYSWSAVQVKTLNGDFCGPYIYEARDFPNTPGLSNLLAGGYKLLGRLDSPFGDYPTSTLQTYLASPMVYVAPPDPASGRCKLILNPLKKASGEALVPAHITMTKGWSLDGAQTPKPEPWKWPIYGSWSGSDRNTGTIQIGPFRVCGDFLIPYTAGRNYSEMFLNITERGPDGESTLFKGIPPVNSPDWEQIEIHQPGHKCAVYTLSGSDDGTGPGEWMALGAPTTLK